MDRQTRWALWWEWHAPTLRVAWHFVWVAALALLIVGALHLVCGTPGYPDHRGCRDGGMCGGPDPSPPGGWRR